MDSSAADLARRIAARLAPSDPSLAPLVEAELAKQGGKPAERFPIEWIGLAGLLVSIVGTAYPILKDWRRGRREALRRRLVLALDEKGIPATGQRDAVVETLLDVLGDRVE
jgi:hypothetical protein